MFGALLRIFSYGSMAVKGAKKARDAMSSEQAEAAKAIVKDPEGWGDSLSSGWDKVKEESFELKDAFLTLYRIQIGRRTTKKERKNAVDKFAMAGTILPPLRVFSLPGAEMFLGVAAFVMPFRVIPDSMLPNILRSHDYVPDPSKKRLRWFRKEKETLAGIIEIEEVSQD